MRVAHQIHVDFLDRVVRERVFSAAELTRGSGPLGDVQQRQVAAGQRIDIRRPELVRISGKGGASPDNRYAAFTNVTLLDHLLSVQRGALMFAAMDLMARAVEAEKDLSPRLAVVAAVAFLHDADKMLAVSRSSARAGALDPAAMAGLMDRFAIAAFLDRYQVVLSPAQMLELVNGVEVTAQQGLVRVPSEHWHDRTYVRLADRVDGTFLQTGPLDGRPRWGVDGALHQIATFAAVDTDAVHGGPGGWRVVELRDPHTPFLLDAFQAALSAECLERNGIPPLIELHHDGRMLVILPGQGADAVITAALGRATGQLGARIRVSTNARGKVDLLDAPGTVAELRDSIAALQARDREKVLLAGKGALRQYGSAIDRFMGPVDFLPRFPDLDGYPGQLVPLWTGMAKAEDHVAAMHRDAVLVGAVLGCTDPSPRLGIPPAVVREAELRELLLETGAVDAWPGFLDELPPDTKRALMAGFAAGAAREDDELREGLFGPGGLVALWLEGRDGRLGLSAKIDRTGVRLRDAVATHYGALLSGRLVVAADEDEEGRCHFTNAPAARSARIDGKTGLYGVNVSAFSGRAGRPESFRSSASETLVSPVAEAEHKLRRIRYEGTGRSAGGRRVSVTVTSPTTAGLFGALPFANDADADEFALSDVLRSNADGGKLLFHAADAAMRRTRVARFEELPGSLLSSKTEPGLVAFVRMVFEAALRTGRPVHVFRGLPRQRPEFVAFDSMPQPLVALLRGDAFRLEEIEPAVAKLKGIDDVAGTTGFGLELALRLCDRETRFGAACDALTRAENRLDGSNPDRALPGIRTFAAQLLEKDSEPMPSDTALLAFGGAMARVQRSPLRTDGANMAELGLRTALSTAEALERMSQAAPASMVAGIAGELEKAITRGGLAVRRELRGGLSFDEVVETAAKVFVDEVWQGAFGGTLPASRDRRVALAVYRHGFKSASRELYARFRLPATEDDSDEQAA